MSATVDRARAYRVFAEALEQEPPLRESFIAEQCADKPELQYIVGRLLVIATADTPTGSLVENAPVGPGRIGREFGHFRLLELLGTGGMGAVYRAERTDGVPQIVALKVLRAVSPATSSQFLKEARILARLEHPAIARLIDAGIQDGEAWIAMEFIRGCNIVEYCEKHHLDITGRIRLLNTVADAVAMAHRMLVVHRDIKPTNVLVTDDGQPKLIDFGIAAALADPGQSHEPTIDIRRFFTPHFAAPEQVRGEPVTVLTDVFSLGALGYRLLTGCLPFAHATSPVGYLLTVTQSDVDRPSRAASAAGAELSLVRRLRGDPDAILLKALERDPARRYASVQELQRDLNAYLVGLPVSAHPSSVAYRTIKFVRRHTLGLSVATLVMVGLLAGAVIYAVQERRVTEALAAAAQRDEFLEQVLKSADPRTGRRDITVAELLDSAQSGLDQRLGREPLVEASMLGLLAETNSALGRYQQGLAASEKQLTLLEANGGSQIEVARALLSRGELFRAYGQYAQGVPVLRRARALLQPLSAVDADKGAALNELGMVLANTNHEKEAESLFRQAIDIDQHLDAQQRAAVGLPLQNLAVLLGHEGRYTESADFARQGLTVLKKYLPPDHPDLLTAEGTYAMTLLNLHDPPRAEPILRDIIARSSKVRGPNHTDTLVAQVQLGEVLIDLKRFAEAEQILRPTAAALDRVEGADTRYATGAWSDYAVAACSGQDGAEGLEAARRIDAIRTRTLPADDWHRMGAQADIGLCLVRLHRYAEAEPILLEAAAGLEAARGLEFYTTQLAYKSLHELYEDTGRGVDATRIAAKVVR
jgi:tetratricopeptide (TPR) repeat protein/predicted Ser/Thr protein kinase